MDDEEVEDEEDADAEGLALLVGSLFFGALSVSIFESASASAVSKPRTVPNNLINFGLVNNLKDRSISGRCEKNIVAY